MFPPLNEVFLLSLQSQSIFPLQLTTGLACVTNVSHQERIKGTEKASSIHTLSIGNSSRVIFKTTDPKGD